MFIVCMCVPSRSSHGHPTIYRDCDCRSSPAGVPRLASPWAHDAAVPAVPAVCLEPLGRGDFRVSPYYVHIHSTGMRRRYYTCSSIIQYQHRSNSTSLGCVVSAESPSVLSRVLYSMYYSIEQKMFPPRLMSTTSPTVLATVSMCTYVLQRQLRTTFRHSGSNCWHGVSILPRGQ